MSRRGRILVVEDDRPLAMLLVQELSRAGYEVEAVHTGGEGLFRAEEEPYDLLVLDLNLPDVDGVEIAEALRGRIDLDILMLTARADVDSRVRGLYAGADDYLSKPFNVQELLARVHARLRSRVDDAPLRYEGLRLVADLGVLEDEATGRTASLPELEFRLLELLLRNRGRVFAKEEIERHLYGPDLPGSNTVEVFVHNLRKRFRAFGHDQAIRTVRGKGYLIR